MSDEKDRIRGTLQLSGLLGPLWFAGWLFTIGFAHLVSGSLIWALIIWPYYLGVALR